MPIKKAAKKAQRVTGRHQERNVLIKKKVRDAIRAARSAITAKKTDEAKKTVTNANSLLDRAAKKGVYHKRTAARLKSRLATSLAKIGGTKKA